MKLRTPRGLGTQGTKLWTAVTSNYSLRPDELRILEDACRLADVATRLEQGMVGGSTVTLGSRARHARRREPSMTTPGTRFYAERAS